MTILGIVIRRAKTIRKILRMNPIHEQYLIQMLQIYECRILGLCIYRTLDSFKKLHYDVLNEASTESQTLDQHEGGEAFCNQINDCIHQDKYKNKCLYKDDCSWKQNITT